MPETRKQIQIWKDGTVHVVREFNNSTRATYHHYGYNRPVTDKSFSRLSDLSYKLGYRVTLLSNRTVMVSNY